MKLGAKTAIAAAIAAAGVALSATSASAYIACNDDNVCWHVHRHVYYHYRHDWGVVVHPDDWDASPAVVWRDHDGRGYWRHGVWITF